MERMAQCHCGSLRVIPLREPEREYCMSLQLVSAAPGLSSIRLRLSEKPSSDRGRQQDLGASRGQRPQDPLSFLPELRQHHFVALAARTSRQQRFLGG